MSMDLWIFARCLADDTRLSEESTTPDKHCSEGNGSVCVRDVVRRNLNVLMSLRQEHSSLEGLAYRDDKHSWSLS